MSLRVYWLSCSMYNAFQWNCFNLVDTCNITLILLLKCDVTKFRIPPPLVTQCHTSSTPSTPLNVWCNLCMPPNLFNLLSGCDVSTRHAVVIMHWLCVNMLCCNSVFPLRLWNLFQVFTGVKLMLGLNHFCNKLVIP